MIRQERVKSQTSPSKSIEKKDSNPEQMEQIKANKVKREDIENDQLLQRLRNIQKDIRQRRIKQQGASSSSTNNQSQMMQKSQTINPQMQSQRPNMQSAKSLDLQYYPLKQQQQQQQPKSNIVPRSAAVRIVQPNGTEPAPTKNRIRLIRSNSKEMEESNEMAMEQPPPIVITNRPEPRMAQTVTNGRHTNNNNNKNNNNNNRNSHHHNSNSSSMNHRHTVGHDLARSFTINTMQMTKQPTSLVSSIDQTPMRSTYF